MSGCEKHMSRLLKFTADWCGPCQRVAGPVRELASKYNVEIETINIDDDEQNLSNAFKVTVVPTIILIDSNKKELDKVTGTDLGKIEPLFRHCSERRCSEDEDKTQKHLKILDIPISDDAML